MKHALPIACTLALTSTFHLPAQQLLSNGSLEAFPSGLPSGWTYFQGDGAASIQSTSIKSPFGGEYPTSTASALLVDGPSTTQSPSLSQVFTASTGSLRFSYDFFLDGPLAGNPWYFIPASAAIAHLNNVLIDNAGFFSLGDNSGNLNIPLTASTWYRAIFDYQLDTKKYSGSLTPYAGTAVTWSNRSMFSAPTDFARVLFYDGLDEQNTSIAIDNVSVRSVPEPSVAVLLALGAALQGARRRRSRR